MGYPSGIDAKRVSAATAAVAADVHGSMLGIVQRLDDLLMQTELSPLTGWCWTVGWQGKRCGLHLR